MCVSKSVVFHSSNQIVTECLVRICTVNVNFSTLYIMVSLFLLNPFFLMFHLTDVESVIYRTYVAAKGTGMCLHFVGKLSTFSTR